MDRTKFKKKDELKSSISFREVNWFNNVFDNNSIISNLSTNINSPTKIFNTEYVENSNYDNCNQKLNVVYSIPKTYTIKMLECLVKHGINIFQIDGNLFTYKEYTKIVEELNLIFKCVGDTPTIIFDLKGPTPIIKKIGESAKILRKGQLVKICFDNNSAIEDNMIYIDKPIACSVNKGDIILINNSKVKLKIISVNNIKISLFDHQGEITKNNFFKVSSFDELTSHFQDINHNANMKDGITTANSQTYPSKEIKIFDNPSGQSQEKSSSFDDNFELYDTCSSFEKLFFAYNEIIDKYKVKLIYRKENTKKQFFNSNKNENNEFDDDKFQTIPFKQNKHKSEVIRSNTINYLKNKAMFSPQFSAIKKNFIICEVEKGGKIFTHRRINLLKKDNALSNDFPILGAKDIMDIHTASNLGIIIFSSLINNSSNLDDIRELLPDDTRDHIKIISRIETIEGIINFDSILQKSDGIIIGNGPLSCFLSFEELYIIESYIIKKCKLENKLLYVTENYFDLSKKLSTFFPFLNEVSSLEYAVKEGFDGIIISEQTETKQPEMENSLSRKMCSITSAIHDFEMNFKYNLLQDKSDELAEEKYIHCLLCSAVRISYQIKCHSILLLTDQLKYLKKLYKLRPNCRIIYPTGSIIEAITNRLMLGVTSFYVQES